jgi:hypothetical protein
MIETRYICDRCSSISYSDEQFWKLQVTAQSGRLSVAHNAGVEMQVCRPCLESIGIYVQPETKAKPGYVERTTEDILRELINRVTPE